MSSAPLGPHLRPVGDSGGDIITCRLDAFHIEDFTSASDGEREIAQVETTLRVWKAQPDPKHDGVSSRPLQDRVGVSLAGRPYWLIKHFFKPKFEKKSAEVDTEEEVEDEKTKKKKEPVENTNVAMNSLHESPLGIFPPGAHPVSYFFGFHEFVLVVPQESGGKMDNEAYAMEGELTRSKQLISQLQVAANNTTFYLPVLVQVGPPNRCLFQGFVVTPYFRTVLETTLFRQKPPHNVSFLNGILSVFKEKIRVPFEQTFYGIRCIIRKTYFLEDWTFHAWAQSPPDLDLFSMFGSSLGSLNDLTTLPFGATKDPVRRLALSVTWPECVEELVMDTAVHSDFEAMDAPLWSVVAVFEEDPGCLLGGYLHQFTTLCQQTETVRQVLGDEIMDNLDLDGSADMERLPSALTKLTGPTYTLTDILKSGRSSSPDRTEGGKKKSGPIRAEHLKKILEYLFPDSTDGSEFAYTSEEEKEDKSLSSSLLSRFQLQLSRVKSAPSDGLVWRLAVIMAHCLHVLGGIKPVAHLIHELLLEVRYRWESGHAVPGLPPGPPDSSQCLLHQKLQMLNYCIERKRAREAAAEARENEEEEQPEAEEIEEEEEADDDDEFYDCDADDNSSPPKKKTSASALPVWERKAEGRSKKLGKLRLLEHDDALYVPMCQDPAPMTEDQLAEQAEIMLQLGSDSSGSEIRSRMQSASLLSDMESFKAANPGCVLGDFVRWHSPRDWDDETKTLSARMRQEDGAWKEAWENAKPVPARRQKRLFDDTKEAEKVFQYLTSLTPGEASQMLLPTLLHAGCLEILKKDSEETNAEEGAPAPREEVAKEMAEVVPMLVDASRLWCRPEVQHYNREPSSDFGKRASLCTEVAKKLQRCEILISRALSLKEKFMKDLEEVKASTEEQDQDQAGCHMHSFVNQLFAGTEVDVIGAARGPAGRLIRKMFREAKDKLSVFVPDLEQDPHNVDVFPEEESKEYVVQLNVPKPYPYSGVAPQRLYACLKRKELRFAGAWSVDKMFM